MKQVEAYARLRELAGPVVSTREAAALWGTGAGNARRRLRSLADAGLVLSLRRGLWSTDTDLDPFALAPYLTAPFPAYVTTFSALAAHGMIEQVPRQVSVASLDRSARVETSIASFEIHHLAPELFGGYVAWRRGGHIARPEKALFDLIYLRAAAGGRAYVPELSLPEGFDTRAPTDWSGRIRSGRLRTMVRRRTRELQADSGRIGVP